MTILDEILEMEKPIPKKKLIDAFWKQTGITAIRSTTGSAYMYLVLKCDLFNKVSHIFKPGFMRFIMFVILFAFMIWSAVCVAEIPANIPSYYSQVKRGFMPEPFIRMHLIDLIPLNTDRRSLTIDPVSRYQIEEVTRTVKRTWDK